MATTNVWRVDTDSGGSARAAADAPAIQLAPEGRAWNAYNEEGFHYFLALERVRAARANRPIVLVLASAKRRRQGGRRMDAAAAERLFMALWLCTRDVDFIGWYREGQIAGAVLTPRGDAWVDTVLRQIRARVAEALVAELPSRARETLRVHACQLMPRNLTS